MNRFGLFFCCQVILGVCFVTTLHGKTFQGWPHDDLRTGNWVEFEHQGTTVSGKISSQKSIKTPEGTEYLVFVVFTYMGEKLSRNVPVKDVRPLEPPEHEKWKLDPPRAGDRVEFAYKGQVVQGRITQSEYRNGEGVCTMSFEYNGRRASVRMEPKYLKKIVVREASEPDPDNLKLKRPPAKSEPLQSQEVRTWQSAKGGFKVDAKLLSSADGVVKLEKADGRVIDIPLEKLSQSDHEYLKQLEADDPFAGGERRAAAEPEGNRLRPKFQGTEIVLVDSGWSLKPDGAPAKEMANRIIDLLPAMKIRESADAVSPFLTSTGKRFIGFSIANPNPPTPTSEISVIDADNASMRTSLVSTKHAVLAAISPDGNTAVTFKDRYRNRALRGISAVDFWDVSSEDGKHVARWDTTVLGEKSFLPTGAHFVDDKRLLTYGRNIIIWNYESAKAIYSFKNGKIDPAFSPNGQQMAMEQAGMISLINLDDGKQLGRLSMPKPAVNKIAFSQSGQFLAGLELTSGHIYIWDLLSGEMVQELATRESPVKSLVWIGDEYLLIDRADLFDIELRNVVWSYKTFGELVVPNDGRFWIAGKNKMVPISLPHRNLIEETAKLDPDELALFRPGIEVSIKMSLPYAPTKQKALYKQFVKQLEDNNITVRDGADVQLVLSVSTSPPLFFIVTERGSKPKQYKYSISNMSIYLTKNRKRIWGRYRECKPSGTIYRSGGLSAKDALFRETNPDISFFRETNLPKFAGQMPDGKPLGESTISQAGVVTKK